MQAPIHKRWLLPTATLGGAAVAVFAVLYGLDRLWSGKASFFDFDPGSITDAAGAITGMIAAVLGIIITVVSIVVQLSAERSTHVPGMFFRDRTNRLVFGFYVIACVTSVLTAAALRGDFVPRITLTVLLALTIVCFALMGPYFAYVFDFVQPENIILRVRRQALVSAGQGGRTGDDEARAEAQADTVGAMEQMTDITVNSISGKDKIIATAGVDALRDFAVSYLGQKRQAAAAWFAVGPRLRKNPDFVSMNAASVDDMERRHTWVEWKVLRQYQGIYTEALAGMRDVAHVITINTRYIGEAAIAHDDGEAFDVAVKFMNTFLRATLNARDVRTAYNLLHQYRELGEAVLRGGWHERAARLAGYMKYYAHVAYRMDLAFVTETAAYDLCALCETAHGTRSTAVDQILRTFLEVDQPAAEGEARETGLRGVRKAQVKLATYYLTADAEELARRVFEDMKHERPERLRSIRDELTAVTSPDFWEVIDRGANFDYLAPERRRALSTFFSWFPRFTGAMPAMTIPVSMKEA